MKKEMTFSRAFQALEKLVDEIEDDGILLDTLAEKVKEANELITFCETRLRAIETDIKDLSTAKEKKPRKKKDKTVD